MTGRLARDIKQSKPFSSPVLEVFFNLLRTTDELTRVSSTLLKPHDLTGTQYNVLRILRGAGDAGLPCSEIGNRLITHDPDVTRLVDRLEKRGLVARSRDSDDRRVVTVRVTSAGLALIDSCDMDNRTIAAFAERFARLTADETRSLITALELLRDAPTDQGT